VPIPEKLYQLKEMCRNLLDVFTLRLPFLKKKSTFHHTSDENGVKSIIFVDLE